jgi:protein tyrosine phosphatase (PTP) superfamily phosphohydrolase (DUF442 family)
MIRTTAIFLIVCLFAGCDNRPSASHTGHEAGQRTGQQQPIQTEGLHNVLRFSDKIFSGSSPDGDEGFRSLQRLGVQTILSVDGARPDIERARKYGLRYVHLPIGYDGVPREQALRIARAVRDLPGPVYIHCHHGKHRGPAAAAVAHLFLDEHCTPADAVAEMHRAGTDAHYAGLYASAQKLRRPTPKELDQIKADFPEVAPVAALAEFMVSIDTHWDQLKLVQQAGWKTPKDHTDLDPPHEALQLAEQFREAARLPSVRERAAEFRQRLTATEQQLAELEGLLRDNEKHTVDRTAADKIFRQIGSACSQCHAKYRDVPRKE